MIDIVERLRDPIANYDRLRAEAAAEIERLRFELKAAHNEIEIADGEIERLRAVRDGSNAEIIALNDALWEKQQEIKRLREAFVEKQDGRSVSEAVEGNLVNQSGAARADEGKDGASRFLRALARCALVGEAR